MKDLLRENSRSIKTRTARGKDLGLAASSVEAPVRFADLEEFVLVLVITWPKAETSLQAASLTLHWLCWVAGWVLCVSLRGRRRAGEPGWGRALRSLSGRQEGSGAWSCLQRGEKQAASKHQRRTV